MVLRVQSLPRLVDVEDQLSVLDAPLVCLAIRMGDHRLGQQLRRRFHRPGFRSGGGRGGAAHDDGGEQLHDDES
jgi:hypothetical protein